MKRLRQLLQFLSLYRSFLLLACLPLLHFPSCQSTTTANQSMTLRRRRPLSSSYSTSILPCFSMVESKVARITDLVVIQSHKKEYSNGLHPWVWNQKRTLGSSLLSSSSVSLASTTDSSTLPTWNSISTTTTRRGKPNIVILGSGAIGCYYGARLVQTSKYNVYFYMRSSNDTKHPTGDPNDKEQQQPQQQQQQQQQADTRNVETDSSYTYCKTHGLRVTSIHGDILIPPHEFNLYDSTIAIRQVIQERMEQQSDEHFPPSSLPSFQQKQDNNPQKLGVVDWIFICLKSTAFHEDGKWLKERMEPLLGSQTRILAIMNGLIDEDLISFLETPVDSSKEINISLEGTKDTNSSSSSTNTISTIVPLTRCAAIYGGMAFICCNRVGLGHVDHSYAGKLSASLSACSSMVQQEQQQHKDAIRSLFQETQPYFEFVYDDNLTRARWLKNVWNLPFNGISVAMGGITVDRIVMDPGLRWLAYAIMNETIAIANADLKSKGYCSDTYLGESEKQLMMSLTDTMGPYKTSTMIDLISRRPMEVKYLFRKPLERAKQLNVHVPHLETIVAQIEAFQRTYGLY